MANATSTQLQELYVAYFGRAADPTGLDYWTEIGITTAGFAANMYAQPEFATAYGSKSTEAQVNQIYKNLFDREADVTGLTYWTQQINLGNLALAEIATHLIYAAQNNTGSEADNTALTNRTNAAVAYTAEVKSTTAGILAYQATSTDPWVAGANITEAVSYLTGIDGTTAHTEAGVKASVNTITAAGAPSAEGKNLTLTTGVDTIEGGANADTISGTVGNSEPTITAGDSIDGGVGSDIFAITSTGTTGTVAGVSLTGIETVRVSDTSSSATNINLAGVTGVTLLQSFGSANTSTMTFQNVGSLTDLSLSNTSSTAAHTISYTTATVEGTSDAQNITLDTATNTGVTTIAGVETVAYTASGESSSNLVAAAATTVTINAADATTLTLSNAANTELTTVTGSGAGAVTYVVNYGLSELSITGGGANDVFDISAAALGANDTLDGGDGTDTLKYIADADTTSVAGTADSTTIANVEVLELETTHSASNDWDYTIDLDTTEGVTSLLLDANDTNSVGNFILNDINATQIGAITAELVAGGATIQLDHKDGTGTADAAVIAATMGSGAGTLTVTDTNTNLESLSVTATGDADQAIAITAGGFAGSTSADGSLTISGGAAGRTMTISNSLSSETVDLSGVASNTTATLATGVDHTYTGGTGNDVITMTTGLTNSDTINGGDGTDTLSITQATTISTALSVTNTEILRVGGTGTASLNFNGTSGLTEVDLEVASGGSGTQTLRGISTISKITVDADQGSSEENDYQALTIVNGYTGTADSLTIDINSDAAEGMTGNSSGLVTASGVETLNITLDGGEAIVSSGFTSTTLATVVVTANSDFVTADTADLGTLTGGTKTTTSYDSSGADIAVTVTVADLADNASVVLGDGADTFVATGSTGTNITIDAGSGIDNITGATGVEIVNGGAGNDIIDGVGGGDTINGDAGNDTLTGAADVADTIDGGAGNDKIYGEGGLDSLTGGTGVDTFYLGSNVAAAADLLTITDFTAGAGGDILALDVSTVGNETVSAISTSATSVIIAAKGALGVMNNSIVVVTGGTGYASDNAAILDIDIDDADAADVVFIYFNNTANVAHVVATSSLTTTTADVCIAKISNITTVAGMADFTAQNFDAY